jgi:hypothetical protein
MLSIIKTGQRKRFSVRDMPENRLCRIIDSTTGHGDIGCIVIKIKNTLVDVDDGIDSWWNLTSNWVPDFIVEELGNNDILLIKRE